MAGTWADEHFDFDNVLAPRATGTSKPALLLTAPRAHPTAPARRAARSSPSAVGYVTRRRKLLLFPALVGAIRRGVGRVLRRRGRSMSTIGETWNELDALLRERGGPEWGYLRGPAEDAQMAAAEAVFGRALPPEVRASMLVHDGEGPAGGVVRGWRLLPASEMVAKWRRWQRLLDGGDLRARSVDPDPGVQAVAWHPAWIPVTESGHGDHHCIDLAPTEGGTAGQVIVVWHDEVARRVVASSFHDLIRKLRDDIAAGRAVVDKRGFVSDRPIPRQ